MVSDLGSTVNHRVKGMRIVRGCEALNEEEKYERHEFGHGVFPSTSRAAGNTGDLRCYEAAEFWLFFGVPVS